MGGGRGALCCKLRIPGRSSAGRGACQCTCRVGSRSPILISHFRPNLAKSLRCAPENIRNSSDVFAASAEQPQVQCSTVPQLRPPGGNVLGATAGRGTTSRPHHQSAPPLSLRSANGAPPTLTAVSHIARFRSYPFLHCTVPINQPRYTFPSPIPTPPFFVPESTWPFIMWGLQKRNLALCALPPRVASLPSPFLVSPFRHFLRFVSFRFSFPSIPYSPPRSF